MGEYLRFPQGHLGARSSTSSNIAGSLDLGPFFVLHNVLMHTSPVVVEYRDTDPGFMNTADPSLA